VNLTEILYDATRTPLGLVIETNDAERLRQKLYAIRKDDPALHALSFVISPFNGSDLWILNKAGIKENENAEG
jgi:hypothetical protein